MSSDTPTLPPFTGNRAARRRRMRDTDAQLHAYRRQCELEARVDAERAADEHEANEDRNEFFALGCLIHDVRLPLPHVPHLRQRAIALAMGFAWRGNEMAPRARDLLEFGRTGVAPTTYTHRKQFTPRPRCATPCDRSEGR